MLSTEGGRYEGSASSAYSPNIVRPGRRSPGARRAVLKIALCLLLPPIGLLYIWRTGSFRLRGRVLATALSFVSMLLMLLPTMKGAPLVTIPPNPAPPTGATRVPDSDVATALSNIEQLLIAEEAAEAARIGEGEMAPAPGAEQDQQVAADLAKEAIYNTTVYSVKSGAKLYHAGPTCGTQANRRELTVRQAISEGLGACEDCNPPYPH